MVKSAQTMVGPRAVPEAEARSIIATCRACLEEDAPRLDPSLRMRMLAIQRAMEATPHLTGRFDLKDVNDQIRQILRGAEEVPAAVAAAARRADLGVTRERRRSFFTSYISGKWWNTKNPRFNFYVRSACNRLDLGYVAVVGGSPDGTYTYYYLKHARGEAQPAEPVAEIKRLTSLISRGAGLLARRGWAAEEVGQAYLEARSAGAKISARANSALERLHFEVAIGLWSHHLVRGNLETATAEATLLRAIAGRAGDESMQIVALRAAGTTLLWRGGFREAGRELGKALDQLGDGARYRPFASDLGATPWSLIASDLAAVLFVLGRHKEAIDTIGRTRAYLAGRNDPFHHCYSLAISSWIKLELGLLADAAADARNLIRLAAQFGLAVLRGLGTALDGVIRAFSADDPNDGVGNVYRGLGEWQASGSALFVSWLLTKAAMVWLRAGNARQAELAIAEALEVAERSGDGFYLAEIHRVRSDIQWMCHKNFTLAAVALRQAVKVAEEQGSLTYRLRAAMSLVGLSRQRDDLPRGQTDRETAGHVKRLKTVYDLFAAEPAFADVRTARSLIVLK